MRIVCRGLARWHSARWEEIRLIPLVPMELADLCATLEVMSEDETTKILLEFEAKPEATEVLVKSGVGQPEAGEMVFIASGGSDVVEGRRWAPVTKEQWDKKFTSRPGGLRRA